MGLVHTGSLIICPTPLGNLGDVTFRSKAVWEACDAVCCEDTRVTGKLLAALGIEKPLVRLDEASIATVAPAILTRIEKGETIAYCSDAGMPGISDPGQRLITLAYERGITVEVLPGPTAFATAYVASGFTHPQLYFGAFMPRKQQERIAHLQSLAHLEAVLVFYESPQRVVSSLQAIADVFPSREVALCRELTKIHEEVLRGSSQEVYEVLHIRQQDSPIKGECVIVIDAPTAQDKYEQQQAARKQAEALLQDLNTRTNMSNKDKVALVQQKCGLARNEAYRLVEHFK